jgi:ketopantoate reductase
LLFFVYESISRRRGGGRHRRLDRRRGGNNAEISRQIRHDVWGKLWGNMKMNPLSALTRCGTDKMLAAADVRELCVRMMEEMQLCAVAEIAQRLDVPAPFVRSILGLTRLLSA